METEVTVAQDRWATIKRVVPRDVYELLIDLEKDIATEWGRSNEGLGASVDVWTVITRFLDENRKGLMAMAHEFVDDSGNASSAT